MLAALLPFVLLSLIAQGNMLARDPGSQRIMMVLCGASLPVPMMTGADGMLVPAPPDEPLRTHQSKPACGWALHAQPAMMTATAPQPIIAATIRPIYLPTAVTQYLRRIGPTAFLARGPPSAS